MRVVKYRNRLPTSIVTAPSVNSFKRQLDSAWEELFAEIPWFPILLSQTVAYIKYLSGPLLAVESAAITDRTGLGY